MDRRTSLYAVMLAGLAAAGPATRYREIPRDHESPKRARAWRELARTGKRQGERLARQHAKGMLDFSASEKCIARIKAKLARI